MNSITKKCTKCGLEKELDLFYINKECKYGRNSVCIKCFTESNRKKYNDNKEKFSIMRIIKKVDILASAKRTRDKYKERNKEKAIIAQKENPEIHLSVNRKSYKKRSRELREEVISAYGGKCSCCGETTYEFLSIDHVNGGGGKMRKDKTHPPSGKAFYSWLKRNSYPDAFQILCHNCNLAKGFYGICPHKRIK